MENTFICPVCDSKKFSPHITLKRDEYISKKIEYIECDSCKLIQVYPKPIKELKKLYREEYKPQEIGNTDYLPKISLIQKIIYLIPYSSHFKKVLDFLKPYIKKGNKVLDVGCREGKLLYMIRKKFGGEVYGIEPTTMYANFANKWLKIPTINGFIEESDMIQKFDIVIFDDVFEHIFDPNLAIEKIKKLLNSNGKIFIQVPHEELEHYFAPHLWNFNEENLQKLFLKHNFKTIEIKNDSDGGFDSKIFAIFEKNE
jgi:2-polyprenyl-3-methyl-5-hydroxy-6-metoxy-1,4-benzoquinol methylase